MVLRKFKSDKQRRGFFSKIKQFRDEHHVVHVRKLQEKERKLIAIEKKELTELKITLARRKEIQQARKDISTTKKELAEIKKERFLSSTLGRGLTGVNITRQRAVAAVTSPKAQKVFKRIGKKLFD